MNHPVLGEIERMSEGGWQTRLSLPAFLLCYERWDAEGKERRDTRGNEEKNGRFLVHLAPAGEAPRGSPPSDAQVAAVDCLLKNQQRVAQALGAALVSEAPEVYHWDYLDDVLADVIKQRLGTTDGMLQIVELQSLIVYDDVEDSCGRVGFSFHSELLEPEHGVGIVMRRDEALVVGTWEDLM